MKVVIDTNVLISSTEDDLSSSKKIVDEVIAGKIQVYLSDQTMRENKLLLSKIVPNPQQKRFLEDYFAQIQYVRPVRRISVCHDDSEDNKFFEVADTANAEYIISNDRHLLDVGEFEGIKVVKPDEFWYEYRVCSGDSTEWRDEMKSILGM